ncbi:MutS family DNA mismatch repair protein [Larkinella harenae]
MEIYKKKIGEYEGKLAELQQALDQLSTIRLIAFVGSIALILFLANAGSVTGVLLVLSVSLLGFGYLIKQYNRRTAQKRHITFLKEINEQEVLRAENKLAAFPTGQRFINRDHAYASDVDVFGNHSIFQLINRTTTESGQIRLAEWLTEPASKAVIQERQQAIQELTPQLDWRQHFQAAGMPFTNAKSDYAKLLNWIDKPVHLLPSRSKHLTVALVLAVLATVAGVVWLRHLVQVIYLNQAFSIAYLIPFLFMMVVNSRVLKKVKPLAEEIIENTQQNVNILGGYESLISAIETGSFRAKPLQQLQGTLRQGDYSAVQEIGRLKKILEGFQQRGARNPIGGNAFYSILNSFWLLDIHWIILTEKWKSKNRSHLRNWAWAVSEFEVFSSLAGFSYANPSFTFPEIKEELYWIHFEALGHPLIHAERRVCNDFDLTGRGTIAMITGSNMAGKSTFLRTIGINLVLALMGAPCCAASGQVSTMRLFTSMRTQDNLEEGVSSFYAELKRIEQLLALVESGQPIFFLLDEMFKGTNSQDRYKGGVSLIKQLNELNAFGLISTHDLELANVAAEHMTVTNFSFNSVIQDGNLLFNYKLNRGICTDFNASELMKRSGIKLLSLFDQ